MPSGHITRLFLYFWNFHSLMKKAGFSLFAMVAAGFSLLLISCAPEACFEETNAYLKATFYSNSTKEKKTPDSLTVTGVGKTDKIYDREPRVQPALLPLDASNDTSEFIIRINGITDTIQFIYSSYPHLISKECGYTFYHKLDTFHSAKDIFYIYRSSNNITTANEENIRIFF